MTRHPYIRLVHSQPAEDCVDDLSGRPINWGFIAVILATLAFDAWAVWYVWGMYAQVN